ncbi:hypothetical protein [Porphyrobacter sp. AAP60]|nr:hypothetical protein [Porphyrobacter sp. AAP60]
MTLRQAGDWLRQHRWPVTFVCVIVFGYSYGKDMALRDNARDAALVQGTE